MVDEGSSIPAATTATTEHSVNERAPLLARWWPQSDIVANRTSEPRDLLMSERTFLSWVKCGVTLCLVAMLVSLNFRLNTQGKDGKVSHKDTPGSFVVSLLLCILGIGCFLVACIAYFQALKSYRDQKIKTYNARFLSSYLSILCVTLFGVSIYFMVTA